MGLVWIFENSLDLWPPPTVGASKYSGTFPKGLSIDQSIIIIHHNSNDKLGEFPLLSGIRQ